MTRTRLEGEFRRFVEAPCVECVLDVHGWQDVWGPVLFVTVLSNHQYEWRDSWRGRLSLAREALRGRPFPCIELHDADEAGQLITALTAANANLWPKSREWPRRHGIRHPHLLAMAVPGWIWKRTFCSRDWHLWDEVRDDEGAHYMVCDACDLEVYFTRGIALE